MTDFTVTKSYLKGKATSSLETPEFSLRKLLSLFIKKLQIINFIDLNNGDSVQLE